MKFMREDFAKKKRKALKESVSVSDDLVLNQIGEYLNFLECFLDDIEEYVINRENLLKNDTVNKTALEVSDSAGCYLINTLTAINNIEINASEYIDLMNITGK